LDFQELEKSLLLGQQALADSRFAEAARRFDDIRQAVPGEVGLCQMAAQAWRLAGDVPRERAAWLGAFAGREGCETERLFDIGSGLLLSGAPFEAKICLEAVVRSRPRDSAAIGALAAACRSTGDLAEAYRLVRQALVISPRSPTLCLTAAQIRHCQGNLADSHRWLDKAERLRPDHGPTKLQRGLTWLMGGPCTAGWAGFEHRGLPTCPTAARPWHGEPLAGQSIAVLAEQGLGDLFHFLRFVPELTARGAAQVIVEAPTSTHRLLELNGFRAVAPGHLPPTDWHVPILSLPHRLGTDGLYEADRVPYLRSDAPRSEISPQATPRRRRFGVTWQGNPAFLATALRDLDPALLPPLADAIDADWISLQVDQAPPEGFARPDVELRNWLDTAQLLTTLDAVVSVDTAIAHLAGALGLPTLVLLPYSPDWRWGLTSETTRWYPTATLLRQPRPRDWAAVIDHLIDRLRAL
jgi:tetratricopeptide (TPR) repeat protein